MYRGGFGNTAKRPAFRPFHPGLCACRAGLQLPGRRKKPGLPNGIPHEEVDPGQKNIVVSEGFPKLMLLEFLDIDE
jgi:hypothetical protein